jgi:hypothetical protein
LFKDWLRLVFRNTAKSIFTSIVLVVQIYGL